MTTDIKSYIKPIQHIAPDTYSPGNHNGVAVDMKGLLSACFVVDVGELGALGSVDAKLQYSQDGITGWTDETSGRSNDTAITRMTATGVASLRVASPRERYYRILLTIGTAASNVSVLCIGNPSEKPQR